MRRDIYLSLGVAFACSAVEAGIRSNFIIATVYILLSVLNLIYILTRKEAFDVR